MENLEFHLCVYAQRRVLEQRRQIIPPVRRPIFRSFRELRLEARQNPRPRVQRVHVISDDELDFGEDV